MSHVDGAPPVIPWTDAGARATLRSYNQGHRHGFLRLSITKSEIAGVYRTVPRP